MSEQLTICAECEHHVMFDYYGRQEHGCVVCGDINVVTGKCGLVFCAGKNRSGHCPDFDRKPERVGWWKRLLRK
jgi:hypothetical protein